MTGPSGRTTRERILDVALDLFIDQGYDKASIREIAERMGFTKAAVHYHFPAKADMLKALHGRMHGLLDEPLELLGEGPVGVQRFEQFLYSALDKLKEPDNQKLFVLHQVNSAALSQLHIEGHDKRHVDMEERVARIFSDPTLPSSDRVRMAAAMAAAMFTPFALGQWASGKIMGGDVPDILRRVVHEILAPAPAKSSGRRPPRVGPPHPGR